MRRLLGKCVAASCDRDAVAHGLCLRDYKRVRRHGDPNVARPDTSVARFGRFVDVSAGLFGCWPWTGARNDAGYGAFHANGRRVTASRFALELALGRELRPDEWALHGCDNPPCVRVAPDHVHVGTVVENNAEIGLRNRHWLQRDPNRARGEGNAFARLTDASVRAIRSRRDAGDSIDVLAAAFGIDRSTAWKVATRRTWSHVA